MELAGGQSAADLHGVAATRTLPFRLARSDQGGFLQWRVGSEQMANQSNAFGTVPVGQESKLANAHEAVWEDMLHVALQELRCREGHQPLFVAACIVLPAKSDLFPSKGNKPVIADGNAMGIAAQIAQYRSGTSHRLIDIDDPAFSMQRVQKCPECLGIFARAGEATEAELALAIGTLQTVEKLASKYDRGIVSFFRSVF